MGGDVEARRCPGVIDYRCHAIVVEEANRAGIAARALPSRYRTPYLTDMTNDEQKARWLAGTVTGTTVPGIAMTHNGLSLLVV